MIGPTHFAMMRLASPAMPIGGFSYSQGLESAIDCGWVQDEASLITWLRDALAMNVGRYEAPLLHACVQALLAGDMAQAEALNADCLASRESAELHAETVQMGYSLLRVLAGLTPGELNQAAIAAAVARLAADRPCSLPMAYAHAAPVFGLSADEALAAWLWSWLENQVAAAIKTVPLGQQAGQRVLDALLDDLTDTRQRAATLPRDAWCNFAPGFAMASSWHETQYSRLFRS